MLKHYPREYERIFTDKERLRKKFNPSLLEFDNPPEDYPSNVIQYKDAFRKMFHDHSLMIFKNMVRYEWLSRKFRYKGFLRRPSSDKNHNGFFHSNAFAYFLKDIIGRDIALIKGNYYGSGTNFKIISYLDDFFPNFMEGNPFKDEHLYIFPYNNVLLEEIIVIYNLPERLEMLDYIEEQNMSYVEFLDYLINYLNCYNDEHGRTYDLMFRANSFPFIVLVNKPKRKVRRRKRRKL